MQRWHYQCQVCVIRPVSPLPYNLGSPYWIHTLIMVYTFQLDMHHLILTSISRFFDFVKVLHETDETYICLHLYKLLLVYCKLLLFLYSGYPCIQGNFCWCIEGTGLFLYLFLYGSHCLCIVDVAMVSIYNCNFCFIQGNCCWCNVSGRKVVLKPSCLSQLTESERHALQKIVLSKLQAMDLGCSITIPKGNCIFTVNQ